MWAKQPGAVCVFCLASSLTAACHEHVALQAPSAAAPEPERVAAYSKLRPFSYHETKTWLASEVLGVMTERKIDYLQLAGGERIYYPEDILGVVPSDSPAGRAAGDSQSSRQLGNGLQLGGFASLTAGVALALFSLFTVDASTGELKKAPLYVGLGFTLGGVGLLAGAHFCR